MDPSNLADARIGIIGLGYVGLPLAVEFGKQYQTIGFDINSQRIAELKKGHDSTLEVEPELLQSAKELHFSSDKNDLAKCDIYIVTVPTPIDKNKRPDLRPLQSASRLIGEVIGTGNIAIFESTVYPGCTEEVCVPIIEAHSKLTFNEGFFVGYSPERINPGDKEHRVTNILKVTSGSTDDIATLIDNLYRSVITAGTHKAASIRVAEAAKVIENTQRDLNIALINELAILFNQLDIDTTEVLEAAGTKWNFLPFRPGLVGGHCISVDPYYLTYKAEEIGYHPDVILAGRRINDGMGPYVAEQVVKLMTRKKVHVVESNILILGLAFKENCPDLRNTRVIDVINEFQSYHANVDVYDPWVDADEAEAEYGIRPIAKPHGDKAYDAIIICVAHNEFLEQGINAIRTLGTPNAVVYDVKSTFPKEQVEGRL